MIFYNDYLFRPFLPPNCAKPPTIYAILNSIVNGDKEDEEKYEKIVDLPKLGRKTIFNFTYPLSTKVNKEEFEILILNHFLMRRIGFETVTAFRINLNAKLNEIMPKYNKMFDSFVDWSIFEDGEITTRVGQDNRNTTSTQNQNSKSENTSTSNLENNSTTKSNDISDRRNSDTPQNELDDVKKRKICIKL